MCSGSRGRTHKSLGRGGEAGCAVVRGASGGGGARPERALQPRPQPLQPHATGNGVPRATGLSAPQQGDLDEAAADDADELEAAEPPAPPLVALPPITARRYRPRGGTDREEVGISSTGDRTQRNRVLGTPWGPSSRCPLEAAATPVMMTPVRKGGKVLPVTPDGNMSREHTHSNKSSHAPQRRPRGTHSSMQAPRSSHAQGSERNTHHRKLQSSGRRATAALMSAPPGRS